MLPRSQFGIKPPDSKSPNIPHSRQLTSQTEQVSGNFCTNIMSHGCLYPKAYVCSNTPLVSCWNFADISTRPTQPKKLTPMNENNQTRNKRRFYEIFITGRARLQLLDSYNWYRNLTGGWTHPHCLDFMSRREILKLTPAQLDYKLQHGSQAPLPKNLQT